ncbi:MAG: hypothetical protein R3F62_18670 [Planctomycetota bacterium]
MSEVGDLRRAHRLLQDPQRVSDQLRGQSSPRLTAWVHGAIRHRRSVRAAVGGVARRAFKGRQPETEAALILGGWRLLFGREADPARAIEQAAELVGGKRGRSKVARPLELLQETILEPVDAHAGDDDVLPLTRERALRFREPVLQVSGRRLAARLGILHSYPDELVERWLEDEGEAVARELCWAHNDPPPLFARINPRRSTLEAVREALAAAGVETGTVPGHPLALRLEGGRAGFHQSEPWREGWFTVQDLTAQQAAAWVDPAPGERVLDLCAAPGGKTTAIAEAAEDAAEVWAVDKSAQRLARVERACERLGLRSVRCAPGDGRRVEVEGPFDATLVDAPCSNSGVLRRRPEARWRLEGQAVKRLARVQAELLERACALTRGRVIYSVCSIEPAEGRDLVRAALPLGWELVREERWLPRPDGGDGGYLARLEPTGR